MLRKPNPHRQTELRADRIEEYWDWFAVALFVLITVDMLTTIYAASYVGPAAEANPLMRWAIGQGLGVLTMVNLAATILAVGIFKLLLDLLEETPPPYRRYFALSIEAWLGLIISAGLFVFANNLAVIVHGQSLLFSFDLGRIAVSSFTR